MVYSFVRNFMFFVVCVVIEVLNTISFVSTSSKTFKISDGVLPIIVVPKINNTFHFHIPQDSEKFDLKKSNFTEAQRTTNIGSNNAVVTNHVNNYANGKDYSSSAYVKSTKEDTHTTSNKLEKYSNGNNQSYINGNGDGNGKNGHFTRYKNINGYSGYNGYNGIKQQTKSSNFSRFNDYNSILKTLIYKTLTTKTNGKINGYTNGKSNNEVPVRNNLTDTTDKRNLNGNGYTKSTINTINWAIFNFMTKSINFETQSSTTKRYKSTSTIYNKHNLFSMSSERITERHDSFDEDKISDRSTKHRQDANISIYTSEKPFIKATLLEENIENTKKQQTTVINILNGVDNKKDREPYTKIFEETKSTDSSTTFFKPILLNTTKNIKTQIQQLDLTNSSKHYFTHDSPSYLTSVINKSTTQPINNNIMIQSLTTKYTTMHVEDSNSEKKTQFTEIFKKNTTRAYKDASNSTISTNSTFSSTYFNGFKKVTTSSKIQSESEKNSLSTLLVTIKQSEKNGNYDIQKNVSINSINYTNGKSLSTTKKSPIEKPDISAPSNGLNVKNVTIFSVITSYSKPTNENKFKLDEVTGATPKKLSSPTYSSEKVKTTTKKSEISTNYSTFNDHSTISTVKWSNGQTTKGKSNHPVILDNTISTTKYKFINYSTVSTKSASKSNEEKTESKTKSTQKEISSTQSTMSTTKSKAYSQITTERTSKSLDTTSTSTKAAKPSTKHSISETSSKLLKTTTKIQQTVGVQSLSTTSVSIEGENEIVNVKICPKTYRSYCLNGGECFLIEKPGWDTKNAKIPYNLIASCKCRFDQTLYYGFIIINYSGQRCEVISYSISYIVLGYVAVVVLLIFLLIAFLRKKCKSKKKKKLEAFTKKNNRSTTKVDRIRRLFAIPSLRNHLSISTSHETFSNYYPLNNMRNNRKYYNRHSHTQVQNIFDNYAFSSDGNCIFARKADTLKSSKTVVTSTNASENAARCLQVYPKPSRYSHSNRYIKGSQKLTTNNAIYY